MLLVDHGQANAAQQRLVHQRAVFLPAVQGGQRVELALDRPVGADDGVFSLGEPETQHLLQLLGALQAVGHIQAVFDQRLTHGFFIHRGEPSKNSRGRSILTPGSPPPGKTS
ncbi:hypothetical protein D3C72_1108020 [compost metagenome]